MKLENQRIADFLAGAKWWDMETNGGATMWPEDQNRAVAAAKNRLSHLPKMLGSSLTMRISDFMAGVGWWNLQIDLPVDFNTVEMCNKERAAAREHFNAQAQRAAIYAERGEVDPMLQLREQQIEAGEMGTFVGSAGKPDGEH